MAEGSIERLVDAVAAARAIAKAGVSVDTARIRVGCLLRCAKRLEDLDRDPAGVLAALAPLPPGTRRNRLTAIRTYYRGRGAALPEPYAEALRRASRAVANERTERLGSWRKRRAAQCT